jgi:hypothetical protein
MTITTHHAKHKHAPDYFGAKGTGNRFDTAGGECPALPGRRREAPILKPKKFKTFPGVA